MHGDVRGVGMKSRLILEEGGGGGGGHDGSCAAANVGADSVGTLGRSFGD